MPTRGSNAASAGFALAVLCLAGAALRLSMVGQSFLADELATYWDISGRGVRDLLSTIHSDAEISPPLSFVLSWMGLKIDAAPEWVRAPSLAAGVGTIVAIYFTGNRLSGRAAGLTAAGLTTFAPFMVYYSTEARGYALAMFFVALSTLAMVNATVGAGRRWWWLVYGAASCAAAYTHYTCVFVLAFQFGWLFWCYPAARRYALAANAVAMVAYLPWLSGLRADLDSPTTDILSALQPFTAEAVRTSLTHWSIGYPYGTLVPVDKVPGTPGLVMLILAVAVSAAAVVARKLRDRGPLLPATARNTALIAGLALSVPLGEAAFSALGNNLFSTRNLAASWPGFALAFALLLVAAGPRLRFVTSGLAVLALAIGAVHMLSDGITRPQYQKLTDFINANSRPGDVVIDETGVISPGPLTSIDPYLKRRGPVFRSLKPQQRDHPFTVADPVVSPEQAAQRAVAAADGRRIFLATDPGRARVKRPLGDYRLVESRRWPGLFGVEVRMYEPAS